jgi:cytochrome c553
VRIRTSTFITLVLAGFVILCIDIVSAQAPAARGRGAAAPPARGTATPARQLHANLLQLMRGILFPNSNVIFSAQTTNPASVKPDADATSSVNPLAGMYGGWQAIENSGLAIAETANLLTIPGRVCANGKPVPVQNADWQQFVKGLRDAGMAAYKAGQSKNMDAVVEVADTMTTACMNCHDVYREKTPAQGGLAARCTK